MKKFLALFKILYRDQFKGVGSKSKQTDDYGKLKKKGNGGKIALIIFIAISMLPLLAMFVVSSFSVGLAFNQTGVDITNTLSFIYLCVQGIVLMFGLPMIINNVLSPTDGEKLLYMPISKSTIYAAKMAIVYVNEMLTVAIATLLVLLPLGIGAGMSAMYYVMLVFGILLVPMLPLAIGSIISVLFTMVFKKFLRKPWFKTIFGLLLFAVVFGGYMVIMSTVTGLLDVIFPSNSIVTDGEWLAMVQEMLANFDTAIAGVVKYVYPNTLLTSAMTSPSVVTSLLNLLGCVAIAAVSVSVTVLVSIRVFSYSIGLEQESGSGKKVAVNLGDYKPSKVVPMLMGTSIKRYMRNSKVATSMIMNLLMPVFLMGVFMFAFNSEGGDLAQSELFASMQYRFIVPLAILGYFTLLCSSTNVLGIYPFSMDKESLYIYKIIPVPFKTIFLSKLLLALVPIVISSVIVAVAGVIMLGVPWYSAILMCLTLAVFQFGTMCVTGLLDLKKPNFNWDRGNTSLKNTKNALIALALTMGIGAVVAFLGVVFGSWYFASENLLLVFVMWLLLIAIGVGYSALAFNGISRNGAKTFNELEL